MVRGMIAAASYWTSQWNQFTHLSRSETNTSSLDSSIQRIRRTTYSEHLQTNLTVIHFIGPFPRCPACNVKPAPLTPAPRTTTHVFSRVISLAPAMMVGPPVSKVERKFSGFLKIPVRIDDPLRFWFRDIYTKSCID